jgi:hypothetical protein
MINGLHMQRIYHILDSRHYRRIQIRYEIMLRDDAIEEYSKELVRISFQMAELARIKEELEFKLLEWLDHPPEGQKTYIQGKYKITMTTGYNYKLDIEEYEIVGAQLPRCFQPVRQRIAYDLNKEVIRDIEKYGSKEEQLILSQFVSKTPKKLHVRVSPGV